MAQKCPTYKSVIIGCGKIAGGYDNPGDKDILTHAHAVHRHKKAVLSGVYDISQKKAQQFAKKWKTVVYSNLKKMFHEIYPEIVYVCVPTKNHIKVLKTILHYNPKVVICEKPLSDDMKKTRAIVREYKKRNIALGVNYTRRFDTTINELKTNIQKRKYGSFLNSSMIYTKGILHNGSHAIDLLRYFFGEVDSYKILDIGIDHIKTKDPSLDVFLKFRNGAKTYLMAGEEESYSIFEFDMLFSKMRIKFHQFGLQYSIQNVRKDPVFPGYKDLGCRITRKTHLNKALLRLVDNIVGHIENGRELLCDGEDASKTQEICFRLFNKYKKETAMKGKRVT